jgi:thiol-disulfide isomerase/thioredoxin
MTMKLLRLTLALLTGLLLLSAAACNKQEAKDAGPELNADRDLNNGRVEESSPAEMDVPEQPGEAQPQADEDGASAARRIPDFQVRNAAGEVVPISSFYGRPLVVNFWGDWCEPCKAELPIMNEIYNERKAEFEMIAVSVDSKEAEKYWAEQGYTIPLYHDVDGKQQLGLGVIPTTFFIESSGAVSGFQSGEMTAESFEIRLKDILLPVAP